MSRAIRALVGVAFATGVAAMCLSGCRAIGVESRGARLARQWDREAHQPKAHGGTQNVNAAAADAMFFRNYGVNPFVDTDDDPLSTFAVDVDTGSYTLCRSYLGRGALPPKDAVRVEEFVNYFNYGYQPPDEEDGSAFAMHLEAAPPPFDADTETAGGPRLLFRAALKAREVARSEREPAVLTFVIDVSGSMAREDRLELVKKALRLLVRQLRESDRIGIAVFSTQGRVLLAHRGIEHRGEILSAIEQLAPENTTNLEEGLHIGYQMAERAFRRGAINRVILCSDGVANENRTGGEAILNTVRDHVGRGITLSSVGFGMGNYNDVLMEQLADKGNGHYAYVDAIEEAERVFVDNLTGTLQVVARDVKVQVDFNPKVVRSYRLVGYENREVADRDFRSDRVDGGQVGGGHAVTALYELKLWPGKRGRMATIHVRYKGPDGQTASEDEGAITTSDAREDWDDASPSFKLAVCVAHFAEILRGSRWARGRSIDDVLTLARHCKAEYDDQADVSELVTLIKAARKLGSADGEDERADSSLEE